jgi:hypothetical protein
MDILLKKRDNTLMYAEMKFCPKITSDQEIILIGVIPIAYNFTIFEQQYPTDDVFFLISNESDKILHYSTNCGHYLSFSPSLMESSVRIEELFPSLDKTNEDLYNKEVGVVLELDSSVVLGH